MKKPLQNHESSELPTHKTDQDLQETDLDF